MSNKEQKKAKVVKFLHTAADKTGKFVRKAVPWIGGAALTLIVTVATGGKNNSNKA